MLLVGKQHTVDNFSSLSWLKLLQPLYKCLPCIAMTCTVLYIVMSTSSTSWHLNMLVQNFPLGFRAVCKTYKKMIEHDSFHFQNQFCTPRHSSHIWHSKCNAKLDDEGSMTPNIII